MATKFSSWMINVNTYIWLPRTANKNFNLCDKIRRTICNKAKVYISDRICRSCHKPQEKKPHTFAIKYISQKYCFIISLFLQSIACTILVRLVKFMYWIQRRIFFKQKSIENNSKLQITFARKTFFEKQIYLSSSVHFKL